MKVVSLTEARVRDLPMGSGIWRDTQIKGLLVICHKTAKTYAVQGDVRRNGRFIRTVRIKIDRCDRMGLREARLRGASLMLQIQSGVDPSAGPEETGITLEQILVRYLEARQLSPFTVEDYQYHVDFYLAKWKNRAVADITRADVRTRLHEMREKHGNTTGNSVMRTLRALINEARRLDESITANPVEALRIPQNNRRQVDNLDLEAWWPSAQAMSPMRRDLHTFFLFTGLRKTSTLTIRRRDVDLDKAIITVQHMKSGRPFILPLSDFLVDMLKERMEHDVPLDSEWLWPSVGSKTGSITNPYEGGFSKALGKRFQASAVTDAVSRRTSVCRVDGAIQQASVENAVAVLPQLLNSPTPPRSSRWSSPDRREFNAASPPHHTHHHASQAPARRAC